MNSLAATARIIRDAATSAELTASMRRDWCERLRKFWSARWQTPPSGVVVRLGRRIRAGAGGRMVRAVVIAPGRHAALRLKWCPTADPAALEATAVNMRWWRAAHPDLAANVAELLDDWPDQRVLVMAECEGEPLSPRSAVPETVIVRLARWMRAYAYARRAPLAELKPRLGAAVSATAQGRLVVDARRLLATRAGTLARAADDLGAMGFSKARTWPSRFPVDGLLACFREPQRAGMIHGDFKPGNVLLDRDRFTIVDWWIAPCVSWPLTDVATFLGNLWLSASPDAQCIADTFAAEYFSTGIDPHTIRALDLMAGAMVMDYLSRRMRSPVGRCLERNRCARLISRLLSADHPFLDLDQLPARESAACEAGDA